MNHSDVAHKFAYGNEGKGSSMYSQNNQYSKEREYPTALKVTDCYSFQTIVARRIEFENQIVFLISPIAYSSYSSRHKSKIYNAIRGIGAHVTGIVPSGWNYRWINNGAKYGSDRTMTISFFQREIESIKLKLAKARKPELYISQLLAINKKCKNLVAVLNWDMSEILLNEETENEYRTNAGAAQQRENERLQIAQAKQDAKTAEQLNEKLPLWRNNLISSDQLPRTTYNFIRLKNEMQMETSLGVTIPVTGCIALYNRLKSVLANGGCTNCGKAFSNEPWEIKEVNKKKVVIGCHSFEWSELENAYLLTQTVNA